MPAASAPDDPPQTAPDPPGYPATLHIALRRAYLVKMALYMAAVVVVGIAAALYFWPLAWHPVKRAPFGGMLAPFIALAGCAAIVVGLYYLVFGAIWAAKGQTGLVLDADGYTDSTMLTQLTSVRILWSNVKSITARTDDIWPFDAYVCVGLTDHSVYGSYSFIKRMMTHMTYKRRRRYILFGPMLEGVEIGLWVDVDVIVARGLQVDAQRTAALMTAYWSAWRKEHRPAARTPALARTRKRR